MLAANDGIPKGRGDGLTGLRRGSGTRRMIDQAFIDAFEPERRSEYARQQTRPKRHPTTQTHTRSKAHHTTQTHTPQPAGRSPLPSAREIDAALHVKYGAARYGDRYCGAVASPPSPRGAY